MIALLVMGIAALICLSRNTEKPAGGRFFCIFMQQETVFPVI